MVNGCRYIREMQQNIWSTELWTHFRSPEIHTSCSCVMALKSNFNGSFVDILGLACSDVTTIWGCSSWYELSIASFSGLGWASKTVLCWERLIYSVFYWYEWCDWVRHNKRGNWTYKCCCQQELIPLQWEWHRLLCPPVFAPWANLETPQEDARQEENS